MLLFGIVEEIATRSYSAGNIPNPCCNFVVLSFIWLYFKVVFYVIHQHYMRLILCLCDLFDFLCFLTSFEVWSATTKHHKSVTCVISRIMRYLAYVWSSLFRFLRNNDPSSPQYFISNTYYTRD